MIVETKKIRQLDPVVSEEYEISRCRMRICPVCGTIKVFPVEADRCARCQQDR